MRTILNRKGARKVQDAPKEVLDLLHLGQLSTVNLIEWLAIDHIKLVKNTFSDLGIDAACILKIDSAAQNIKKQTSVAMTKLIGYTIYDYYQAHPTELDAIINRFSAHPSDSIRCYTPYLIGNDETLTITQQLEKAKPLIADQHFGVREVV